MRRAHSTTARDATVDEIFAAPTIARLRAFPRVPLARWPTPIQRIAVPGEPVLCVKRDDLSGHGRGGAKARKIEHLIGHMRARGYDELVTLAGNITNVVFDILPALDRWGIRSRILIVDEPPAPLPDRAQIFRGVERRVQLIGQRRSEATARALLAYLESRRQRRRPLLVLPGLSHPAAVVGNACGFIEMAEQLWASPDPPPRAVLVSVATGTTLAGFLIGEAALRSAGHAPIRVIGVQVYPGAVRCWTWSLIRWTERALRLGRLVPHQRIVIESSALDGGFGCFSPERPAVCRRVERTTGLRIDPIFGGKTWSVIERLGSTRRTDGRPILFWHCGYTSEWSVLARRLR